MNWKVKLVLSVFVFLVSGLVCLLAMECTLCGIWSARDLVAMAAWPCMHWVFGVPFPGYDRAAALASPWFWEALAAVLLWLFARQFWTSGRRPVWLAAAAVAVWWLAGLFLVWVSIVASC